MKSFTTSQRLKPIISKNSTKTALSMIGWGVILAVALFYVFRNALPYFSLDQAFYGHHWSHAIWLLLHITGGILALLLGPFQFWSGLRRRYLHLHRWSGRIYLYSVGISSVAASYILMLPESSFGFRIGIAGLVLAWVTTTSMAYIAIRKRQLAQHKEWMIRSYILTFAFVFFRLLLEHLLALNIAPSQEIVSAVSWMCWSLPLLMTELVLQGSKIFRKRKVTIPA